MHQFGSRAEDLSDIKNKEEFYPDIPKSELFKQECIVNRSGHTRGSTVDLTSAAITKSGKVKSLDMGSPYDFLGLISWPAETSITPRERANRLLLQTPMLKHGFKPYRKEWWHFTLITEPYADTYFYFPIIEK